MRAFRVVLLPVLAAALALSFSGCEENGKGYVILKGGKKVDKDNVGWVAVPQSAALNIQEAAGVRYAVLSQYNGITPEYSGWVAINPQFFTKMSGIEVAEPKPGPSWVLEFKGQRIPHDIHGWIAVPPVYPKVEASPTKKDREMARLSSGQLIPAEMNGWIAVDSDTLGKLVEKYMMTGKGAKASKDTASQK